MRRVTIFVVLAALLLTAGWWMFLINPRNGRIADLEQETRVAVDAEQRLSAQIVQLQEIRDREVEYIAAVGLLDALVPDRPLLEEFIEQIYQLAGDTGVELETLAPSLPAPTTEESELREIVVSVQIEGDFFEILGFLFGLSDMERLVRVDAIALSSSEIEGGGTVLSVSLELSLFTLADLLPIEGLLDLPSLEPETPDTTVPEPDSEAGGSGSGGI